MTRSLSMYTIYGPGTSDYPGRYVVRRFEITAGQAVPKEVVSTASTLETARNVVPEGLYCLPRHATDDPNVVETWV